MRKHQSISSLLIALCLGVAVADPVVAQCRRVWQLDLPPLVPVDGYVYDTVVWHRSTGPELYAVGFFALPNGSGWADGVARWNGSTWEPVGGGVGYTTHTGYPEVHAVAVYNGELIIAGDFTRAGDMPANNIARWNGVQWAPLGDGFHEITYALGEYNGKLIANGYAWDGQTWTPLAGFSPVTTAFAMTVYNGQLIVGGDGGPYLARFDGTSWGTLGGPVSGVVEALTVYNGELIAGGSFWQAGGATLPNIARWNGVQWTPLSAPFEVNDIVKSLVEFDGALVVGGHFTFAGGQPVRKVARWNANGSGAWSGMGTGVPFFSWDDGVFDFSLLNGDLLAAGAFPGPGIAPTRLNWARWSCTDVADTTPIAHLSAPSAGLRYQSVWFDATGSHDPDGTPLLFYHWDFGDGRTEVRSWHNTTHGYSTTGAFTVTLRVSDGELMSEPVTATVTITAPNTPPMVSIASPVSGAVFTAPGQLTIAASASDPDGTITQVEFFQGSTSLGIDTSAPYAVTRSGVAPGRYTLTARARDNEGAVTTSSAVTITVEAVVPSIADAYVRDGSGANISFGSGTTAQVQASSTGNNRWTYLRFDTTGLTTVSTAKLRLFGALSANTSATIRTAAFGSPNTAWGETTMTWNNKPASGAALATVTMVPSTAGRWYEWDLSNYIRQERAAGRHLVTIVLKNTTTSSVQSVFATRENAANQPRLAVVP